MIRIQDSLASLARRVRRREASAEWHLPHYTRALYVPLRSALNARLPDEQRLRGAFILDGDWTPSKTSLLFNSTLQRREFSPSKINICLLPMRAGSSSCLARENGLYMFRGINLSYHKLTGNSIPLYKKRCPLSLESASKISIEYKNEGAKLRFFWGVSTF